MASLKEIMSGYPAGIKRNTSRMPRGQDQSGSFEAGVRGFAGAVPFSNEIQAGVRAGAGGLTNYLLPDEYDNGQSIPEMYSEYRDEEAARNDYMSKEYPKSYNLGGLGATLGMIASGKKVPKMPSNNRAAELAKSTAWEKEILAAQKYGASQDELTAITEKFYPGIYDKASRNTYQSMKNKQFEQSVQAEPYQIGYSESLKNGGQNYLNEGLQPKIYGSGRTAAQIDEAYARKMKMWQMMQDAADESDAGFLKYKAKKLADYGSQFDVVPMPVYGTKNLLKR